MLVRNQDETRGSGIVGCEGVQTTGLFPSSSLPKDQIGHDGSHGSPFEYYPKIGKNLFTQ